MMVTAFETNTDVPKMETVIERLLHEERKVSVKSGKQETGLVAKKKKGPMCYTCKKIGHIKRDCPERSKVNER